MNLKQAGHGDLRRGRPARGVRVHRRAAGTGRAAGRDERPRGRADVRRDRLAGGRVPDDAARAALRLPALLRHAADRARVDIQGVRAGPRPRPGSRAARGCSWWRSARRSRRWPVGRRPAAGHGAAAADAQDRRGARARLDAAALVTGDSLGQVSSQTLPNITALDDAVPLPILRPLLGWDKTEIMAEARGIGTLAISELPDQDCCTLLTPRRVETRARIGDLRRDRGHGSDADETRRRLASRRRSTARCRYAWRDDAGRVRDRPLHQAVAQQAGERTRLIDGSLVWPEQHQAAVARLIMAVRALIRPRVPARAQERACGRPAVTGAARRWPVPAGRCR